MMTRSAQRNRLGFTTLFIGLTIGLLIAMSLVTGASTVQAQEGEVTLSYGTVTPQGAGFLTTYATELLPEVLAEQSPGMFALEYRGGPESFPPDELYKFVDRGALDMASLPTAFYGNEIFLAGAINMVDLPPWELREAGIHEWMEELHRPHGIKYLGRSLSGMPFNCYTNERVESPDDLEGISFYGSTTTDHLLEHFGAEPVHMPLPEMYTALERGVIEGICMPDMSQVVQQEVYDFVNYKLEPGFFHLEVSLVMNLDSWENLTSEQQAALEQAVRTVERETYEYTVQRKQELEEVLREEGLQTVEFTGEDRDRWERASMAEFWRRQFEHSDRHERIRELNRLMREAGLETHFPEELEDGSGM